MQDPIRAGNFIYGVFDLDMAYKFATSIGPNFLHCHTFEFLLGDGLFSHRCPTFNQLVAREESHRQGAPIGMPRETHAERA
jgi:hypothetical protein